MIIFFSEGEKTGFTDTRKFDMSRTSIFVILPPLKVRDLEGRMIQIHIIYIFVYLQVYSRS